MTPPRFSSLAAGLSAVMLTAGAVQAQTTSPNHGSLGSLGDAVHSVGVTLDQPGALGVASDKAAGYTGGANTTLSYQSALNPAANSPFSVEFWVNPANDPGDAVGPSPVFNRVSTSPRSGWVFFQRSATTGFNFAMYNGNGSQVGFSLTGGPYTVGSWNHVVAVWNGTSPSLYVNGVLADDSNDSSNTAAYNASLTATLSLGAYDNGSNPFTGLVDEFAFYPSALTPTQVATHFSTASSTTPDAYKSLVLGDGAVEYLPNVAVVPEPTSLSLAAVGLGGAMLLRRRATKR